MSVGKLMHGHQASFWPILPSYKGKFKKECPGELQRNGGLKRGAGHVSVPLVVPGDVILTPHTGGALCLHCCFPCDNLVTVVVQGLASCCL